MSKPTDERLDELLDQVKKWADKASERLKHEKEFLEAVRDGQGLSGATSDSKLVDEVVMLANVKGFLGI
jgi:hypothetical protein